MTNKPTKMRLVLEALLVLLRSNRTGSHRLVADIAMAIEEEKQLEEMFPVYRKEFGDENIPTE